ncbi:hypothetical protein BC827DRAFT_1271560 [Russula dissimulans]|nr:hypothetical protein BC827DRAFT_1271560 [Russula dissimulans]
MDKLQYSQTSPLPLPPPPPPPPPPSKPPLSKTGHPQRVHHLPARYQDIYPEPPTPAASESASAPTNQFCTAPNAFGLWKEYLYWPSYDPDAFISPGDLYHPHASVINHIPNDNDEQEGFSGYTNKAV